MKKTMLYFLVIMIFGSITVAQGVKKKETKFDKLTSKSGTMIKFIDYNLPKLALKYQTSTSTSRVRKIISGKKTRFFYQISVESEYDTKTASIAYEDLGKVSKALKKLIKESSNDFALHPDYLENKYVTDDGFNLGYMINRGKLTWYANLGQYGSSSIFFENVSSIENALNESNKKIKSLKK